MDDMEAQLAQDKGPKACLERLSLHVFDFAQF
jgi:hypothetical protein